MHATGRRRGQTNRAPMRRRQRRPASGASRAGSHLRSTVEGGGAVVPAAVGNCGVAGLVRGRGARCRRQGARAVVRRDGSGADEKQKGCCGRLCYAGARHAEVRGGGRARRSDRSRASQGGTGCWRATFSSFLILHMERARRAGALRSREVEPREAAAGARGALHRLIATRPENLIQVSYPQHLYQPRISRQEGPGRLRHAVFEAVH